MFSLQVTEYPETRAINICHKCSYVGCFSNSYKDYTHTGELPFFPSNSSLRSCPKTRRFNLLSGVLFWKAPSTHLLIFTDQGFITLPYLNQSKEEGIV
jgi:hypothetical protein